MITHFEALIALLSAMLGMLVVLISAVWKARGWVDRLNTTDGNLATAITELTRTQRELHRENQRRFERIEQRLSGHR